MIATGGYNAISRDPEFGIQFLEEFQDKLYIGTDIALQKQDLPIIPYVKKLCEEGKLSKEAYEKITWQNANRLLDLGL